MPISEESNKILYNTDGLIREFSFNFKFLQPSNIKVSFWEKDDKDSNTKSVELEEGRDYTLIYDDAEEGGFVVLTESSAEEQAQGKPKYPATPTSGTLLVARIMPLDQQAHIRPVSGFPEEVITNTFDKLVMIDQQQQEQLDRCVKVSDVSGINPEVLVEQVERIHAGIDDIVVVADHIEDVEYIAANGEDILKASEDSLANVNAAKEQADIATEQAARAALYSQSCYNMLEDSREARDVATEQAGISAAQASVAAEQANIATEQANIVKEQKIIVEQLSQATNDIFLEAQSVEQKVSQDLEVSKGYAQTALTQAGVATEQAGVAATQADIATARADEIKQYAANASISEANALSYASEASASAYNSEISERASATSATNSKIWAEGTDEEVQALGGEHSAKVWAELGGGQGGEIDTSNLVTKQEFTSGLNTKQDKGNYALKSDIPDVSNYLENQADFPGSLAIGENNTISRNSVAVGSNNEAQGQFSTTLGSNNYSYNDYNICVGEWCDCNGQNSICIGYEAMTADENSIQLGEGFNTTPNSFQVWEHQLLDNNTGLIPDERISTNIARLSDIPQSGGEVEINVTAPIVYGGIESGADNISTAENGRNYLNDKAFWASIPELLPTTVGEGRNTNSSFGDLTSTNEKVELSFRKLKGYNGVYPQLNLDGYNVILHNFKANDIVMGDRTELKLQICFGKLEADGTFVPRIICRTQENAGFSYRFAKISRLYESSSTTLNKSTAIYEGEYRLNYTTSDSFYSLSYKKEGKLANIENIRGVKIIEKDNAYSLAWVRESGEVIELSDTGVFAEIDFNCALFSGVTFELPQPNVNYNYSFDASKFYVANGTIDNVIVRMTEGSSAKSISLKYNTDDFIVEDEELKINPDKLSTMPIGSIIPVNASSNYVPNGTLPCDGAEYTKSQFNDLWENFLTNGEIVVSDKFKILYGGTLENGVYTYGQATVYAESMSDEIVYCFKTPDNVTTKTIVSDVVGYIQNGYLYNATGQQVTTVEANSKFYIKYTFGESGDSSYPYSINLSFSKDNVTFTSIPSTSKTGGLSAIVSNNKTPLLLTDSYYNGLPLAEEKTKLNTCSYSTYQEELATYGQCSKFAVDVDNEKFRVPLIKNGSVIQQALSDSELGKSYNAGLPNIEGSFKASLLLNDGVTDTTGAFTSEKLSSSSKGSSGHNFYQHEYTLNASLSNSIYGNSDTVQMNAVALRYFVVVANGQTNQSLMDWSQWASSLQGKMNADHSNDTAPYIVEMSDKSLLPSWYKVYSNGWCEQGGYDNSASKTVTITLLKKYENYHYTIMNSLGGGANTGTHSDYSNICVAVDGETFTLSKYDTNAARFCFWETKGYIK